MPIDANIINNLKPVQFDTTGIVNSVQHAQQQRMQQEAHAQQMQIGAQQLQANQLENQQRVLDLQDQQAMRQKFPQLLQDNNGDVDKAVQGLLPYVSPKTGIAMSTTLLGNAEKRATTTKALADAKEASSKAQASQTDYLGHVALGLQKSGYDPTAFDAALLDAEHVNPELAQRLEQYRQMAAKDPGTIRQIVDGMISSSGVGQKEREVVASERNAANNTARTEAELPKLKADSEIAQASANALKNMTRGDWKTGLDATIPEKDSPLYKRTAAAMDMALSRGDLKGAQAALKDAGDQLGRVETGVATAKATAPIKIDVAAQSATARADAAGLTDDDYKRSGEQFARTGIMPAMGRDSITRGKIAHEANQWARDNGFAPADIVTMQAAYAGDKESLKKFQAQRDQIVSFEQTAQKNLDLFIGAASKIPDTGLPWLNMPIRMLDQKLVGSANMAAVNAARQVANNEIAKVTSGGGLGGVVSDSARHEVESYNPKDATFAQTLAVAKLLKQDMANRHQSMDASLSDIKQRIGGGAPQAGKPEKWGFDSSGKLVKQ